MSLLIFNLGRKMLMYKHSTSIIEGDFNADEILPFIFSVPQVLPSASTSTANSTTTPAFKLEIKEVIVVLIYLLCCDQGIISIL